MYEMMNSKQQRKERSEVAESLSILGEQILKFTLTLNL